MANPRNVASRETNELRDSYRIDSDSPDAEQMSLPWGTPRGLRVKCRTPRGTDRAATFLLAPSSWCRDRVELDLMGYTAELSGGAHWSDFIGSATALRGIAITSCFPPRQEMAHHPGISSEPKRRKTQHSFLDHLTSTKLKKLYISGRCHWPTDQKLCFECIRVRQISPASTTWRTSKNS